MARKNKNGLIIQHVGETSTERWERGHRFIIFISNGLKVAVRAEGAPEGCRMACAKWAGAWGCLHPANDCGAEIGQIRQIQPLAEQENEVEPHPAFHL